ncbi:hypothetical protein CBR_g37840 [Chara braunii]|uniref:Uncharacterized protein n=1 Tax=Chara braunii TaxID=69332 RepID=A0A388LNS6_CHABU|nr:hypothetical protein CBR_g37840 [Chara braunii]|eukprot:GBG83968.1 hypothetical protein CBR_g37840 [Chara braunii]
MAQSEASRDRGNRQSRVTEWKSFDGGNEVERGGMRSGMRSGIRGGGGIQLSGDDQTRSGGGEGEEELTGYERWGMAQMRRLPSKTMDKRGILTRRLQSRSRRGGGGRAQIGTEETDREATSGRESADRDRGNRQESDVRGGDGGKYRGSEGRQDEQSSGRAGYEMEDEPVEIEGEREVASEGGMCGQGSREGEGGWSRWGGGGGGGTRGGRDTSDGGRMAQRRSQSGSGEPLKSGDEMEEF